MRNILIFARKNSRVTIFIYNNSTLFYTSLYVRQHAKPTRFDNAESWVILSNIEQRIKAKIEAIGTPLKDWNIQINYGIKTGFNDAFIINGEKRAELIAKDPKSAEIIRPILRGRDIKRYGYEFANLYLLFIPWHFPLHLVEPEIKGASKEAEEAFENQYPAIYNHLLQYKKELSNRNKAETGIRYEWYALQRWGANYWEDFYKQVLAWQRITKENQFCLTEKGMVILDSMAFISGIEQYKYWLLALLNSRLIYAWVKWNVHEYGDTGFRLSNQYVQEIPIVPLDKDLEKTIITLLNEKQYHKIDTIIYKLYDLSDEEINFIKALKK